jgi:hypothetical protein
MAESALGLSLKIGLAAGGLLICEIQAAQDFDTTQA